MFQGKKILVTGATGLIGYNLVSRLLEYNKLTIYAAGRSMSRLKETFNQFFDNKNLKLCDYNDVISHLDEYPRFDYVFHAAGPMERDIIINRPIDVIKPNIIDLHVILEYISSIKLSGFNCRLVLFSSITVYQNNLSVDCIVKESETNCAQALTHPMVSYSESKRMSGVLAQSYVKQFGIDVVIARFSTIYGPTKNIPDTAFYNFIKKAINGEDIELQGIGLPQRDNIYIDDAISGLITITIKGKSGEVYNISSNGDLENYASIDQIANIIKASIAQINNINISVKVPFFQTRQAGMKLDNSKLCNLGWSINYSMKQGILKTLHYFL